MEQPRLKIKDKELGLRDLGDNLFEPKNVSLLEDILNQQEVIKNKNNFFTQRNIPLKEPKKYHKIQSFCFVVTENIKEEGAMMLVSASFTANLCMLYAIKLL